ncbi:MAG: ATP-binding protein [Bacteroidota bacterium]|nr:ATP-binding protein [Bacteroidota bacterium]
MNGNPTPKPSLVIVTGPPAAGKTTLAKILAGKTGYSLISRDQLKEDYCRVDGTAQLYPGNALNLYIYNRFFELIKSSLSKGKPVIAEAAFQHPLWEPKLPELSDKSSIYIVHCRVEPIIAKERFMRRLLEQPERRLVHDDHRPENMSCIAANYHYLETPAPTLSVDSSGGRYEPGLDTILHFIS